MIKVRAPLLLTAAAVAGLACRDWPDPVIRQVTPAQMVASETTEVTVRADLPLPVTVDYGESEAEVDLTAALRIGDQELGDGLSPKDGVFVVQVPTVFAPGAHDVTVTLGDGRAATLAGGFTVTEGQWPDSYEIDPIGPQQAFVPFQVTVRAMGADAATFRGNVRFEVPAGASVGPALSDPFEDGVLTQEVVVSSPRSEELLIVTDAAGNRVTSEPFEVR